ncbi:hypothetical protein HYDPIDRAFT_181064 [Hydnomerulius pinastri MD-312]|nr:hypothetical protein HYDPIDRAFT_181064 [Hydnomerulius pinastri MD-312]
MPNPLTRRAGLKLGPVVLETLVKHYLDRIRKEGTRDGTATTQLRQDELLYDEAFNIVKRFFEVSTHHSVEEVQAFSNNHTPSPPWVHVVRVIIPISCCDEAAALVIQALGGEELTSRLVGGTKWWQVRGIAGIDGEWVTAKKDWQEAKKRRKASEKKKAGPNASPPTMDSAEGLPPSSSGASSVYDEDMDELRCILYAHGGGYYFGSLDQERYSIQRHARKINGRVFAMNYRLAPQYPFPCALQDLVAAYLYLIRPPPEASHQPVKPAHIVVAGDSAGGGLILALLQVLRDTGQPLPAGSVLISPWCDLTHSFPSIHTNTATDVLPVYGLSLQKPSPLWPPPSEEMTRKVHTGLRRRIRQMVHLHNKDGEAAASADLTQDALTGSKLSLSGDGEKSVSSDMPIDVGATASLPSVDKDEDQTIHLETKSGEHLTIDSQIHLYTQNSLVGHPLVSPALSYLGGLPPLFVIASDKEVLRDEIIYSAHKAADPSRFPLTDEARALYPPLVGIEQRYAATPVHLQVYDDTAHVLPVLFAFTTPGKYCYRAIATFTKHVTGMPNPLRPTPSSSGLITTNSRLVNSPTNEEPPSSISMHQLPRAFSTTDLISRARDQVDGSHSGSDTPAPVPRSSNIQPSFSRPGFSFRVRSAQAAIPKSSSSISLRKARSGLLSARGTPNVGGPGIRQRSASPSDQPEVRYAGEASVYCNDEGLPPWKEGMIRERVSTRGVIRPLEPAEQLDAFHVPQDIIGVLSERAVRRYLEGKSHFDKKYAKEMQAIEKQRNRNIDLAKKDISKNFVQLQGLQNGKGKGKGRETTKAIKDGLESSTGNWSWAWADERPPPSSIVSRRDTDEARRLARIADQAALQEDTQLSGNSLWAVIVNFLTVSSEKEHLSDSEATEPAVRPPIKKSKSVFASLRSRGKPSASEGLSQ